jgi:hypothetical protein
MNTWFFLDYKKKQQQKYKGKSTEPHQIPYLKQRLTVYKKKNSFQVLCKK